MLFYDKGYKSSSLVGDSPSFAERAGRIPSLRRYCRKGEAAVVEKAATFSVRWLHMSVTDKDMRVLRGIYALGTPTRAGLARRCGMSTVLVSSILKNLLSQGIIVRQGKTQTTGGRPSAIYRLRPDLELSVGIGLKTDRFVVLFLDTTGAVVYRTVRMLELSADPEEHTANIIDQVSAELDTVFANTPFNDARIAAVGITVPGMVDTRRGVWLHGLQLTGIERIPMKQILQERIGRPVLVEDWSRSVAFYEHRRGSAAKLRDFVLLYLGTGVGSGIVTDGRLYRGNNGLAGEVGHLRVEENGRRCVCGNVGCLETIVSTSAILGRFRVRLSEGVFSSLQQHQGDGYRGLTLEALLQAAQAGDRLTLTTLNEIGVLLGEACAKVVKLICPERIVVSGPVSILGDYLKDAIDSVLHRQVLPEMLSSEAVEFAQYGPEDEAKGAGLLAMDYSWRSRRLLAARHREMSGASAAAPSEHASE